VPTPDLEVMLSDLELLVGIESPSSEPTALARSAEVLAELIGMRLGHRPDVVPGATGPHLHWSAGGDPTVLVVGHHDTVFPLGTLAERPFSIANGRATGPGVFDMKAGIVQAVHGIAGLAMHDRQGVEIIITADEEIGSRDSRSFIEQRARACGAVLVLEPSADGGDLKLARKGTGDFVIGFTGRAAHAGLEPEKGANALVEAARQVLRIAGLADPARGTTVTPSIMHSGTASNVVPDRAHLHVDVRIVEPDEGDRLHSAFTSLSSHDPGVLIEVSGGINRPPMTEATSRALFALARRVAAELDLPTLGGVAVGGGSDGNFTAAAGVPTLDGLGAVGGGAHAVSEYVEIGRMVDRAQLVGGIVAELVRAARSN
jgi:glutamate carboxypeptidase